MSGEETSRPQPAHDLPLNEQGRYYHLDCGPGDLAPYVLTCGDPDRARRLARLLDRVEVRRRYREFLTFTGEYHRIPVSVMATGIGPDNTAIAVVEAAQCASPLTFIRLGSCGALQPHIQVGDLIIIMVFAQMDESELKTHKSRIAVMGEGNRVEQILEQGH